MESYITLIMLFVAGVATFIYFERKTDKMEKLIDNVKMSVHVLHETTAKFDERIRVLEEDVVILGQDVDNEIDASSKRIDTIDVRISVAEAALFGNYAPASTPVNPPSEFDMRIERFRNELNTPTYPENTAQTLHPDVYNLPHDTVLDTPLRAPEEYAE